VVGVDRIVPNQRGQASAAREAANAAHFPASSRRNSQV